jgi:hypothetical protein
MAIPEGAIPLAVGTLLALAGLSVVLSPLLGGVAESAGDGAAGASSAGPARGKTAGPRRDAAPVAAGGDGTESAVEALREIEFDRETGKLSDEDYAALKARYTRAALEELRAADASRTAPAAALPTGGTAVLSLHDAVEAAIRRAREAQPACSVCGPRPEPDATYCSSCGRFLPGRCPGCGAPVELVGAAYCAGCGVRLAA